MLVIHLVCDGALIRTSNGRNNLFGFEDERLHVAGFVEDKTKGTSE